MEADAVLMEALGPLLARSYVAVRRLEYAAFSTQGTSFEHCRHFRRY